MGLLNFRVVTMTSDRDAGVGHKGRRTKPGEKMKIIIAAMALAIATQANSGPLLEARLNEACGPLPQVYKECSLTDDKCCESALRRAVIVVECRLRVQLSDALSPINLTPAQ